MQIPIRIDNSAGGGAPLPCGVSVQVHSGSDKWAKCPTECPLLAEHYHNDVHCDFRCVDDTTQACRSMNPKEPVPDSERGVCRSCVVDGCKKCASDGTDTCARCSGGYRLGKDGMCHNKLFWVWVTVFGFVGVCLGVVLAWLVDMWRRPIVNPMGLAHALKQRSRGKLRMPMQDSGRRPLWPLDTNLSKEDVAGPGMALAFDFQVALIVWAMVIAVSWVALAFAYDQEFLILGLRRAENARQNCIIVAFGYEAQRRLMFAKTCYMIGAYLFSFAFFIALSFMHMYQYQAMDDKTLSYKDFAAKVSGLPDMKGSDRIEEELQSAITAATGKAVVGFCMCWAFHDEEEEIMDALQKEHASLRGLVESSSEDEQVLEDEPEERRRAQCWAFQQVEDKVFGSKMAVLESYSSDLTEEEMPVKETLENMWSTGQAFVVFETETDRKEAVAAMTAEGGGLRFRDSLAQVSKAHHEPSSMQWRNVVPKSTSWYARRILAGFGVIFLSMATWVILFYGPYAYYVMSFNYKGGGEPGMVANLAFTMVVVLGNAMMYLVCGEVSDRIGFQYNDDREVCYMLLYTVACIFNVVLDFFVTFEMAYAMMVGADMATYHGVPLAEVKGFQDRFEAYAMQRSLGQNLFAYSFPSTFLLPFLIEPVVTIYLPYALGCWLVRSHKNISKHDAEGLLSPLLMDLSRYADVLLNVMLAAMVFWFPGGFTHRLFFALAFSHVVIYALDHYKVLRCIPSCYYASSSVDWWALWMLTIPCATILSALVFKANCQDGDGFGMCYQGWSLCALVVAAFLLHMIVHTLVLVYLVPLFARRDPPPSTTPYAEVARKFPCSWFSSNPVHCLRSKYIYEHDPPCDFYVAGKEHWLRSNPKIGCYFKGAAAEGEDYSETPLAEMAATMTASFSQNRSRV